jgi:hypothetical protein
VIRGVVVHMAGEQPFIVDVRELPTPTDSAVVCTNPRLPNGKRPLFADHKDSWFIFPLAHVRFLEIPGGAIESAATPDGTALVTVPDAPPAELELDEDFLRRIREA